MWQSYFDKIYLLNLPEREDRKIASTKILNELEVEFELVPAIKHEKGYLGLVETMQKVMRKALVNGYNRILIFEDDIKQLESNEIVNETLSKNVEHLPQDWDLLYLGCNPAGGLHGFYSDSLLPVTTAFATHATAYSKRVMEAVCKNEIAEPIDNWLVRVIQPHGKSFCSYPMLYSQQPGESDITGGYIDWSRFLEGRFNAEIRKLKSEAI